MKDALPQPNGQRSTWQAECRHYGRTSLSFKLPSLPARDFPHS